MTIDGTYAITAEMGGKAKQGTVSIVSRDDTLSVVLDAPVVGKVKAEGSIQADGSFSASGTLRVLLKRVSYTVAGRVSGNKLIAVCDTNMGTVEITGTRI